MTQAEIINDGTYLDGLGLVAGAYLWCTAPRSISGTDEKLGIVPAASADTVGITTPGVP